MASLGISSYGKVWLTMGEWSDSMFYNKSKNTLRKTIESLSLLIRFGMQCVCMMTRKWNRVINPLFGASFIGCLELVIPPPSPKTLICFCHASLWQSQECITMIISIFFGGEMLADFYHETGAGTITLVKFGVFLKAESYNMAKELGLLIWQN